jgi:hypothetical protein
MPTGHAQTPFLSTCHDWHGLARIAPAAPPPPRVRTFWLVVEEGTGILAPGGGTDTPPFCTVSEPPQPPRPSETV